MALTPIERVECFHLVLLRIFEARVDRAKWVVKGGVNLRAWFGSRRYSEDLDIDVVAGRRHVLEQRVDEVLASRPLADLLSSQGLALARVTKPKQTDTTQRWKFEVAARGTSLPLHTRVEFSRRGTQEEDYLLEAVRREVVRPYGIPAPTLNHYSARAAIRQKIQALGGRAEPQARDIWDLDHLLRTTGADPRPLTPVLTRALELAVERALSLPFDVYKAQVVPYLTAEDQEVYGTADAWARMCELVAERLSELVT
jgi:predicted nucleotidyltransferase component of viral defense system